MNQHWGTTLAAGLIVGLSLFVAGCDVALPADSTRRISEDIARETALQYIEARRDVPGGWVAGWSDENPDLGAGIPIYASRDDVPDQIMFIPTCSDGLRCGNIVVRVTDDNAGISELSEVEAPPLEPQAGSRLYGLGPFRWYRVPENLEATTSVEVSGNAPPKSYQQFLRELTAWRSGEPLTSEMPADYDPSGFETPRPEHPHGLEQSVQDIPFRGDVFRKLNVPGSNFVSCASPVPCFTQVSRNGCSVGCAPTAFAMVYAYWDGHGFPNLYAGDFALQSIRPDSAQWELNGYLRTSCAGSTAAANLWSANQFPRAAGRSYRNSNVNVDFVLLFNGARSEIDAGRPSVLNYQDPLGGHSAVVYGYSIVGATRTFRVNTGWGSPRTKEIVDGSYPQFNLAKVGVAN